MFKQSHSEYKWHIEHIYANDAEWGKDYQKVLKLLPEFKNFEGKLGLSSQNLLACLTLKDEVSMLFEKLYPFAKLQQDENTADNKYQALTGKTQSLLTDC